MQEVLGVAGVDQAGQPRPMTGPGSRGPQRPGSRRLTTLATRFQARAMGAWLGRGAMQPGSQARQDRLGGAHHQPSRRSWGSSPRDWGVGGSGERDVAGQVQSDQAWPRMYMWESQVSRDMGVSRDPGQGRQEQEEEE